MVAEGQVTRNYEFIRNWVTKRNGRPGLRRLIRGIERLSKLEIMFSSTSDLGVSAEDGWEEISWETFFERFERDELVFLFQEFNSAGEMSHSYNFL